MRRRTYSNGCGDVVRRAYGRQQHAQGGPLTDRDTGRLGRPRSEIREAVSAAADQLLDQRGCCTFREVAHLAQVAFGVTRYTFKRMAEAGELIVIGHTRAPGVKRPLNLYAKPTAPAPDGAAALQLAVRSWAEFR